MARTDKDGATVEDRSVTAAVFMATVCEALGINSRKLNQGPGGWTLRLTDKSAKPIQELLS